MPSPTRVLITFCVGIAATLAWQSYGDAARQIIASSYPQFGWLAPQAAQIAHSTPDMIALAAPGALLPITSGSTQCRSISTRCGWSTRRRSRLRRGVSGVLLGGAI